MATSPARSEPGLLARALDWIKARAARDSELAGLSRTDIAALAADLGLSEADFRDVLPRTEDNSRLMDRMILARGLDPAMLRHRLAALMRDLELTCTRCPDTARCRRELDAGTAATQCHAYCLNADTFDDLVAAEVASHCS
jgi:hypothetical protein